MKWHKLKYMTWSGVGWGEVGWASDSLPWVVAPC
jgi:hypothetical protein